MCMYYVLYGFALALIIFLLKFITDELCYEKGSEMGKYMNTALTPLTK